MGRNGYTLLEMLITVVLISIIAALAVPLYARYAAQARQADAQVQLTAIRQAQEMYKLQNGSYTTNTASLSGWKTTVNRYTFEMVSAGATAFSARATGNIDGDATNDVWTMDQDGVLANTTDDVRN
jgi:prepilin-type N-terminal cleavage/methylation domain-containing protein